MTEAEADAMEEIASSTVKQLRAFGYEAQAHPRENNEIVIAVTEPANEIEFTVTVGLSE